MATHSSPYAGQHSSAHYYTQGHYQLSTAKSELPRSISTTNLQMTKQCQDYVRNDLCSSFPEGGTCFFMNLPSYTFTIPNLADYPPDFRQFVFDLIIDHTVKKSLEEESCLNWFPQATKLEPLYTKGDGNCLLHAASLGMWGFQDRDHILRNAVSRAMSNATEGTNTFFMRWRYSKELECHQQGYQLEPSQWKREWETVVRQASSEPTPTATLYSLEEFHVFVLANVLRRPVIMYASQKMRSFNSGGTMQTINFHGVYLPLLWAPNGCKKDPLPLSYQGGHFSALVVIDSTQQYRDGKLILPLMGSDGFPLPVRFMLQNEHPHELLKDYLSLTDIPDVHSERTVPCVTLSVNTRPVYYDRLVGAFINACHSAYLAQQQQPKQQPYSQGVSYGGYTAGGGTVGRDGRYASTMTAPVEGSYPPAASGVTQAPLGGEQSGKLKCINNCGRYGDPDTAGLCSTCHEKSLAAALQQESPPTHAHSRSSNDSVSASMSGPTSIKCPNCSQPGHPRFLGMCENCYHGSQSQSQAQYGNQTQYRPQDGNKPLSQPQYGTRPSSQPRYGNQPPQAQYGNQPQQAQYGNQPQQAKYGNQPPQAQYGNQPPQAQYGNQPQQAKYGNQPPQAQYGNQPPPAQYGNQPPQAQYGYQPQPPYGNEPSAQPQYGNQVQAPDSTYEALDSYQKPPIPPQQELSPPPVPLPRSTASPEERNKCRTAGCEFFGTALTRFYCSKCFEENMPAIFKETEKSASAVPTPAPAEQQSYHQPTYHGQPRTSPTPQEPDKCTQCHDYFGSQMYGGLCHGCFKKKGTESSSPGKKCRSCQEFYGAQEYGGLCNTCFLKQTECVTHASSQGIPGHPQHMPQSVLGLPPAEYSFGSQSALPPNPGQPSQPLGTNPNFGPSSQVVQPYLQPEHRHMTEPQLGAHAPPPQTRPVPKPRTRVAVTTTFAQTHTAPVATSSDMVTTMAAMNISNTNQSPPAVNCFMCSGTPPGPSTHGALCPHHTQVVTQQVGLVPSSRGSAGGGHPQQQFHLDHSAMGQRPAHSGLMPNSSQYGPTQEHTLSPAPTVPGSSPAQLLPYGSQSNHTSPVNLGSTAGVVSLPQPTSQYSSEMVKSKPHPPPPTGVGNVPYSHQNYSASGGQYHHHPPSQYSAAGAVNVHQTGSDRGATFNDFNTNTSGSGVQAHRQQEEMGTVGAGLQLGQASGSSGVIVAGGGAIGIQAGVSGPAAESTVPAKEKVLCKTAGCSFYANPLLENLCSGCYEEYYDIKLPDQH